MGSRITERALEAVVGTIPTQPIQRTDDDRLRMKRWSRKTGKQRRASRRTSRMLNLERPALLYVGERSVAEGELRSELTAPIVTFRRSVAPMQERLEARADGDALVPAALVVAMEMGTTLVCQAVEAARALWMDVPVMLTAVRYDGQGEYLARSFRCAFAERTARDPKEVLAFCRRAEHQRASQRRRATRLAAANGLSGREEDVVVALAYGAHRSHTSAVLGISDKTVEGHLANAYAKCSVRGHEGLLYRLFSSPSWDADAQQPAEKEGGS